MFACAYSESNRRVAYYTGVSVATVKRIRKRSKEKPDTWEEKLRLIFRL